MNISIIVAVAQNNVIGKDNRLIWHLPADMKFFKEKTTGHCVVMGRKSYEALPENFRPLPNRTNIIITRQNKYSEQGAVVLNSLEAAINFAREKGESECFIIGGGEIFREAIPLTNKIYLTKIFKKFEGDTFFPDLDETKWMQTEYHEHHPDEKNKFHYAFFTFIRK